MKQLPDKTIDGVKITNIHMDADYDFRTSGYNYDFYFHCDLKDEDAVYALCKKAFPEGAGHVRYDGGIGTYAVDHDRVIKLSPTNDYHAPFVKLGCNWGYLVKEGNDN